MRGSVDESNGKLIACSSAKVIGEHSISKDVTSNQVARKGGLVSNDTLKSLV